MELWFGGSPVVDHEIRVRFASTVESAAQGRLRGWEATPRGALALLIVLDQFPRHLYRGDRRAYALDRLALATCRTVSESGLDQELELFEQPFCYLPLQHSESLDDQRDCVARFEALLGRTPAKHWYRVHAESAVTVARAHLAIIERYGRYPHRNAVLGRRNTLAEQMYLDAGGSTFGQQVDSHAP